MGKLALRCSRLVYRCSIESHKFWFFSLPENSFFTKFKREYRSLAGRFVWWSWLSRFSEESPRSPKRQSAQNNFNGLGDLPPLNPTTPKEDAGFLSAREDKSLNEGTAGHISEAYEDDFGSSANSINFAQSNKNKNGAGGQWFMVVDLAFKFLKALIELLF